MKIEVSKNQPERQMINALDLEAVRLRFEGYSSDQIEKQLIVKFGAEVAPKAQTIRSWFMKRGRLYDFYVAYAVTESKFRRKEALDIFRAHIGNAARTMISLMDKSKSDMVKFLTAKEVINRQLGEPVKPIANLPGKDPADRILEELGLLGPEESPAATGEPEKK